MKKGFKIGGGDFILGKEYSDSLKTIEDALKYMKLIAQES